MRPVLQNPVPPPARAPSRVAIVMLCALLAACVTRPNDPPELRPIERAQLPTPTASLNVPGLGPCTDATDRTLHLDVSQPVNVLVHGCFGSAGRFRSLAQVLAFHGQQTACFSYNDRDSLMISSGQLARAVETLSQALPQAKVTVIGHSQGGLVARKALVADRPDPARTEATLGLVTVSAPFAGIESARLCAEPYARFLTLGIGDLACRAISGDKWYEITYRSAFIRDPGRLLPNVERHLRISTDERDSCRVRAADGRCLKDDYVFSIDEQHFSPVDAHPGVTGVEVRAGHVEIVGDANSSPDKLIAVLQREGVIRPTDPTRHAAFQRLLAQLYGD